MPDNDVARLAANLAINPEDFANEVLNPIGNIIQTERHTNTGWEAFILFMLGSLTIFLITFFGQTILDFLFDFAHKTPAIIQQSFEHLMHAATHMGRSHTAREFTIQFAENLLNDPDTAARAVNAFRIAGHNI